MHTIAQRLGGDNNGDTHTRTRTHARKINELVGMTDKFVYIDIFSFFLVFRLLLQVFLRKLNKLR